MEVSLVWFSMEPHITNASSGAVQLKEEMTLVQCQLKALAKTAKVEDVDELSNTIDRALELGLSHAAEHAVAVLVKLKQQVGTCSFSAFGIVLSSSGRRKSKAN